MNSVQALKDLHHAIQTLGGVEDVEEAGKVLHELLNKFSLTDRWALLLPEAIYQPESAHVHFSVAYLVVNNRVVSKKHNTLLNCSEGILYESVNTQLPRFIHDIHQDASYKQSEDKFLRTIGNSLAVIPYAVLRHRRLVAVFVCSYQYFEHQDEATIRELLLALTAVVSQTVYHIDATKSLQRDAVTDPLTGTYNRRTMSQIVEREMIKSVRLKRELSFIIADIDDFKTINDTQGHLMGDKVLVHCANVLLNNVRNLDYVFRFAGDEFVVLMPETDSASLNKVVARIQKNLANESYAPPTNYTVSIGRYSGYPQNLIDMFNIADHDLYRQKNARKSTRTPARAVTLST